MEETEPTLHITISNPEFYETLREDVDKCRTNWTVNPHVRPGDSILLYITAPISAIVATATAGTRPEIDHDPGSPWYGYHFTDIENLNLLEVPVARAELRQIFPDWDFWKQPRSSVRVPLEHLPALRERLEIGVAEVAHR